METKRILGWFCLLMFLVVSSLVGPEPTVSQDVGALSITIMLPEATIGEGDDFATRVLRAPWDMSSPPYPDFPTVFGNFNRSSFTVAGGQWSMYTTSNDPRINIHPTGLAQPALNVGSRFPIDASRYVLLSFRMCSNQSDQGQVFWFYDQTFTKFAYSYFFPVISGCRIYVIDLRRAFLGGQGGVSGWNGHPIGLSIDPVSSGSYVHIRLDWVRLTTVDTSRSLPIVWEGSPAGAKLEFYVDTDQIGYDGTKIGEVANASANGVFQWGNGLLNAGDARYPYPLPESLQPGQYYVYVKVNGSPGGYTSNPFTVDAVPVVTFVRPSFTSGSDYATTVFNDPWDMNNSEDVMGTEHIASGYFANGIYHARTDDSGDPQVLLRTGTIDTSRYKYLTYRMYVEGFQDIGRGWVTRIIWWNQGPTVDYVVTKDIVVHEDWQTYSLDLSKVEIEPSPGPGWSGAQQALRLDPVEIAAPTLFQIDYVMLTADEQVRRGERLPIVYQISEKSGVEVTLYYDTDRNPQNGQMPLSIFTPPPPSEGPFKVYLPLVMKLFGDRDFSGVTVVWDTTGVNAGVYYLCANVTDGYNTTTWYSDVPVIITEE